ncbi:type I-E CRISPR-associated protein Cas6/Cse3/CasE [Desulfovibrio sp. ZJ200]|uniref:type I-E CRISPR-associated protein Cas6/Cse3/CasE n=1 Tax=Desulfovibrio sp. ZJ200 TaxID=2709792 RepID=UPI0013EC41F0|nr:type I-E CRISPR-associated protein Cas6/Cse3/CasE [Desulfovibrio sp. ZJ200]
MIWLARAEPDMAHALRHGLRDAYDWHKAAWQCFPHAPEARRDFLTRLDPPQAGMRHCRFWLLSGRCPQRPDWCPPESWGIKRVAPGFLGHELYRFDLLANPCRKLRAAEADGRRGKNSRRKALTRREEQLDWLRRKAAQHGFQLLEEQEGANVEIFPAENHHFNKAGEHGLIVGVRFRGLLRVVEQQAFAEAFARGIGSARAFGFGLLMLEPLR